jgi:hypothetical protein
MGCTPARKPFGAGDDTTGRYASNATKRPDPARERDRNCRKKSVRLPGTVTAKARCAMTRVFRTLPSDVQWMNVSAGSPCPVCGAGAGCRVHSDFGFASCNNKPSEWPLTTGAWLHRIDTLTSSSATARDDLAVLGSPPLEAAS